MTWPCSHLSIGYRLLLLRKTSLSNILLHWDIRLRIIRSVILTIITVISRRCIRLKVVRRAIILISVRGTILLRIG